MCGTSGEFRVIRATEYRPGIHDSVAHDLLCGYGHGPRFTQMWAPVQNEVTAPESHDRCCHLSSHSLGFLPSDEDRLDSIGDGIYCEKSW
jgi:hypothetical protein